MRRHVWIVEIRHLTNKKLWLPTTTMRLKRRHAIREAKELRAMFDRTYRITKYEAVR